MYIETRTTHSEVITDMLRELDYKANSVLSTATSLRRHPTFSTKPMLRADANELMGAYALVMKVVGGYDHMPPEMVAKVMSAKDAATEIVGKLK